MWNELIKIRDKHKQRLNNSAPESKAYKENAKIVNHANMLLGQLNTAGGKELMGSEVESFVNSFGSTK
jgi:hypothetical protein